MLVPTAEKRVWLLLWSLAAQTFLILFFVQVAQAGGPMASIGGRPFKWNTDAPVKYKVDRGNLGDLTNSAAMALVDSSFKVWADVSSATIEFQNDGLLDVDVTLRNASDIFVNRSNKTTAIIFDSDGTITDSLFGQGARTDILGFTAVDQANFLTAAYEGGVAVLNGFFVTQHALAADDFQNTLIHEFGHLLGLDHTQLNGDFVNDDNADNDQYIPIMYPFASLDNPAAGRTLKLDDLAWISYLYPAADFATNTGEIVGAVKAGDDGPVQGANIIARLKSDPFGKAVSCVAGFLVTNRGQFLLPGLPAGQYEVRMEPVDARFTAGSSVGPFGPPRGGLIPEGYNGDTESVFPRDDDPNQVTPVNVSVGQQTLDVVFAANQVYLAPENTVMFDALSADSAVGDQLKSRGVIFGSSARVYQSGNDRWVVNFNPASMESLGDIEGFFVDETTGQPTTVGFVQVIDDLADGAGALHALDARGQELGVVTAADSGELLTVEAEGIASFRFSDADGDDLTGFDYLAYEGLVPASFDVDAFEPNDDADKAADISVPAFASGSVSPEGDVDFYSFDGTAGSFIVVDVDAMELDSLLDSRLVLANLRGESIAENDDAVTFNLDSRIVARLPRTGKYQIMLFDFNNSGGPGFNYQLRVAEAEKNDPNEVNDMKELATPVDLPKRISGSIDPEEDIDYFSFFGEAGLFLLAENVGTFTPGLILLDNAGVPRATNLQEVDASGTVVATSDPIFVELPKSETLFLAVVHPGLGGGPDFSYRVALSLLTPEEAFPPLDDGALLLCPLALAFHGDPLAWLAERMRGFRDDALLGNSSGARAVSTYYQTSHAFARSLVAAPFMGALFRAGK